MRTNSEKHFMHSFREDQMNLFFTISTILLVGGLAAQPHIAPSKNQRDSYQHGLEFKEQGQYEDALKTWWQGHIDSEKENKTDPRIGIAFIELATEADIESYFGTACTMYFSSFARLDTSAYMDIARDELARVSPLMPADRRALLEQTLEQNPREFGKELKLFWQEKDPNLETAGNERLIEHWQRIAHARKNFTRNKRTPYDADDRARIYVKYGNPDHREKGHFGSNYSVLYDFDENPDLSKLAELRSWDENPEYDIWIYTDLGTDESVIFMFGNYKGNASFGLRIGVEEFISDKSFSSTTEKTFGIPRPGHLLQYIYYSELEFLDDAFEYRKTNLYHALNTKNTRITRLKLKIVKRQNETIDRIYPVSKYARIDASAYDKRFNTVKIYPQLFRFLSTKNEPASLLYAVSAYQFSPEEITHRSDGIALPNYEIRYSLKVMDQNLMQLDKTVGTPLHGIPNGVLFQTKHAEEIASYAISARALSFEGQKEVIHGLGQSVLRRPFPLNANDADLEISDVVLGTLNKDIIPPANFPFPFIPNHRFRKDDPLQVYLEVYHLQPDSDGSHAFTLDFMVLKIDKKGRIKKKNQISQVFSFTAKSSRSQEHFGIDISSLKKGKYQVHLKIHDKVSGNEKLRTARFEVSNK